MAKAKQEKLNGVPKGKQEELENVKGATEELHQAVENLVNEYKTLSMQKAKVVEAKKPVMVEMKKIRRDTIKFEGYKIRRNESSERINISKEPTKE